MFSRFRRFLSTISGNDLLKLNDWLELSKDNKHYFEQTREIWLMSKVVENPKNFDSQQGFHRFLISAKNARPLVKTLFFTLPRVAAIVAIAFGLGLLSYHITNKYIFESSAVAQQEIIVPFGSKSSIKLPDGTAVMLNAGSKLSYKTNYGKTNREVWLEGEGYFSVAKDKNRTFIVKTEYVDVHAFGTEFNVQAYKDDKELRATLIEGSVGVFSTPENSDSFITLKPSQQAVFNKQSGKLSVGNVDVKLYSGWRDDKCYFENETFASIAKTIERKYNVRIKINSKELSSEVFTGLLDKRKSVYQLLDGMGRYGNFTYKLKNDTIVLNRE